MALEWRKYKIFFHRKNNFCRRKNRRVGDLFFGSSYKSPKLGNKRNQPTVTYRTFISQLFITLGSLRAAIALIRERELWKGINRYNWVFKALFIVGILIGVSFLTEVGGWIRSLFVSHNSINAFAATGMMISNIATDGYESFTSGLLKYVILVLSEVVVFHFMQRTLEEIQGHPVRTDFKAFFNAQMRMIKVAVRSWVMEIIVSALVSVVFGIFGFMDWLESPVLFLVQCYFFGLVILDNYNEQFGMTIKESMAFSKSYMGVSMALGFVLYLLMLVPLVGVVGGTILVSVTGAIVMSKIAKLEIASPRAAISAD